jgi:type IX secretion system PorP/SprF family membrane protein
MKKYLLLLIIGIFVVAGKSAAQQIPISSLFVENPFQFNPAVAGTDKGFKLRMNNRIQWMGFGDSPITNSLNAYGPHKTRNIGYGGSICHDVTSSTSKFQLSGAFASNFFLTSDMRISMGLNLGFQQQRLDGTQLQLDPGNTLIDPVAPEAVMSSFLPDAGAGVFLYHHDWYMGISAQQLFNNVVKYRGENSKRNRLKTHFYLFGGYKFHIDRHWVIEPSLLLRQVAATPFQMDATARVIYKEQFWGGLNVRNSFASFQDITLTFGYIHTRRVHIGVAYDFNFLSDLSSYNAGTIELVLGYNFDPIRKGR